MTGRVERAACAALLLMAALGCAGRGLPPPASANGPRAFPIPRVIEVALSPYASLEEALADGDVIDERRDAERARALTLATAANELRDHLALAGVAVEVVVNSTSGGSAIVLVVAEGALVTDAGDTIDHAPLGAQGDAITPSGGRLYVSAATRVGVLYGVYRLLEELGFDWPDRRQTLVPVLDTTRAIEWPTLREVPRVARRGLWIFGPQQLDDDLVWWMARNRLNLGGRPSRALGARLGMLRWEGGHELVQQEFSRPGLFEEHPDWFALINGVRRPIERTGPYFNPAFGHADAAAFFAERMLERLARGDLVDVDVLNLWPADDRFNAFDQSGLARALGNETDNLLFFTAVLCRALREAYQDGRLDRSITVAGISYFLTMRPPTNQAVVDQLATEDYLHLFYPIERDWSGAVDDALGDRDKNRQLLVDLEQWRSVAPFAYGVVEYYNVSTYGGVALSHGRWLGHDYEVLSAGKDGLFAWMHPLATNAGPRGLTDALLAKLAWRDLDGAPHVDTESITRRWFAGRYRGQAAAWREVHELMARSVDNAEQLFGMDSLTWVLLQEQLWAEPPYTRDAANAWISRYREGGVQELPGGYSARAGFRSSFRGLDESIALQRAAEASWLQVLDRVDDEEVRARLEQDVAWFTATASRYRLLAATCDWLLAADDPAARAVARARAEDELALLANAAVLDDTISPVDQRAFLARHQTLLGAP